MSTIDEIKAKLEADRTQEEKDALAATERTSGKSPEHMIPKSRLDEVIAEREAARKETADLKAAQDKTKADAMAEQGKWKELAEQRAKDLETANAKAGKIDDYEKTLLETLKSQLAELPEEIQALVPEELSTSQKLSWLAKNKTTLLKPVALDIGAGKRGGKRDETKKVELSDDEKTVARSFGYSDEEYAKYSSSTPEAFQKPKEKEPT